MDQAVEPFFERLSQSRLLTETEIASFRQALAASPPPPTAEELGRLIVQSGKLTRYQVLAIYHGQGQGLMLGEYVVTDRLGKGGMGVVFKARHRLMDRMVALKTLPTEKMKPESVQRFYREVKAAARLAHPNIVTAYDAGESSGTHYLVMELVEGRDLAAVLREKGALPLRTTIDYIIQAARGLDYAHRHGVVHRDVKPSNLLLSDDGTIKILDMGLARMNENLADPEALELTGTGLIMGTVDYMSPEHAEDMRAADHRSDIYSLGCTMFYMLTQRSVFSGDTVVKRVLAHRDQPIPSLSALRPDCPPSLDSVFQRMLAKHPEDRYQTMSEVIADLEHCLAPANMSPPVAASVAPKPDGGTNWLESLAEGSAEANTDKSQLHEPTIQSADDDGDVFSMPMRASSGTSSIVRRRPRPHPVKETSGTHRKPQRKRFPVVAVTLAGGLLLALVIGGVAFYSFHKEPATNSAAGNRPTTADSGKLAKVDHPVAKPPVPVPLGPQSPPWESAWNDARQQAEKMLLLEKFGAAVHLYRTLASTFGDAELRRRCDEAIGQIEQAADSAFGPTENTARGLLSRGEFSGARAVVDGVLHRYGATRAARRGRDLLAEIDQAERNKAAQASKPAVESAEMLRRRKLDGQYVAAMEPVERKVRAWDFRGARDESEKVRFDVPELAERLASRQQQIARMADIKTRMIATIHQADPRLRKNDIGLRGINGDLEKADDEAITTLLASGKSELHAWPDLGAKAVRNLVQLTIKAEKGDDWLASGLLALLGNDSATALHDFEKARTLGADAAPCLALLAAADFNRAKGAIDKKLYAEASKALASLEQNFGALPWYAANRGEIDASKAEAKRGLRELDAGKLYSEAAECFQGQDLFGLKPLVERMRSEFGDTSFVIDPQKQPPFSEMASAVVGLGRWVHVARSGKADFKSIEEAIAAAPPNSLIEIDDDDSYAELLDIPGDKEGLMIRGKKGHRPTLTTIGAKNSYSENIVVHASRLRLERMTIIRGSPGAPGGSAIMARDAELTFRDVVSVGHVDAMALDMKNSVILGGTEVHKRLVAKDSAIFGIIAGRESATLENVLAGNGAVHGGPNSTIRHCTIEGEVYGDGTACTVKDSIVRAISMYKAGALIEYCNVHAPIPYLQLAGAGKGCISKPPDFMDPVAFDFRLLAKSACRKAASDGGDLGFKPTAELLPLLKIAADVRRRHAAGP